MHWRARSERTARDNSLCHCYDCNRNSCELHRDYWKRTWRKLDGNGEQKKVLTNLLNNFTGRSSSRYSHIEFRHYSLAVRWDNRWIRRAHSQTTLPLLICWQRSVSNRFSDILMCTPKNKKTLRDMTITNDCQTLGACGIRRDTTCSQLH